MKPNLDHGPRRDNTSVLGVDDRVAEYRQLVDRLPVWEKLHVYGCEDVCVVGDGGLIFGSL